MLLHKRIDALRNTGQGKSRPTSPKTPDTPDSVELDTWYPLVDSDVYDTPARKFHDEQGKLWAEILAKETPNMKRKRHELMRKERKMTEQELYDHMHTPGQEKRRREFFAEDERRQAEASLPTPESEKKKSTVSK